jgi:uncharacterized protein (TIGR02453 family)
MAFAGFKPEVLTFMADLGRNNRRDWFQAHRDDYDTLLLEPARDFVETMGHELGPDFNADPRVGGSIMRIARDTRFSRDKRPYKDHLDLWFWHGPGPSRQRPGLWFRLTPSTLVLGAGKHRFERDVLGRYRDSVVDPERGAALVKAVAAVERAGADVGGRQYKRVPAGYDAAHERAELLLHDGLYAGIELEPVPREAHTPAFPAFCAARYRAMRPVLDWLVELLDRSFSSAAE